MTVLDWKSFLQEGASLPEGPVAATIGVFDGLHRGHLKLIDGIRRPGFSPVVITFRNHPLEVLAPERYHGHITSLPQKIQLFSELSIACLVLIDFSPEFSKITGEEFFQILSRRLDIKHLAIGANHRLGYQGGTTAEKARRELKPAGITVDVTDPLMYKGKPVSSTRIREAVRCGDFNEVRAMLGRDFVIDTSHTRHNRGEACYYLEKRDLNQITPGDGDYTVDMRDNYQDCRRQVTVGKDRIAWTQDNEEVFPIKSITFGSNLIRGERDVNQGTKTGDCREIRGEC